MTGAAGLARPLFNHDPGEWLPGAGAGAADASFSLLHGLYWLAANMAAQSGLLLAVDDAHWADRPSLRALLYLVQRIEDLPIAVLVACRRAEPGPSADLLAELAAHPGVAVIEPNPLSGPAAVTLIRAHHPEADDEFCAACAEVSGGNPFFLDELLLALDNQGVTPDRNAVDLIRRLGRESISRAVLLRLARLPLGAVTLARAVAVLGDDCHLGLAASLAGLELADAAALADQLTAVGIFAPSATLSFVHPVVESAISTETPAGERAHLHARAALHLHQAGSPVTRTAVHLLAVPPAGQAWVVDTLRASARLALAEGAADIAVRQLDRALAEPPPSGQRADVLRELGIAEARAGHSGGPDHLIEAAGLVGDPHQRASLLLDAGRALFWLGRNLEAAATFDDGLAALAGADDDDLAKDLQAAWVNAATMEASLRAEGLRRLGPILAKSRAGTTARQRALLAQVAFERTLLGDRKNEPVALALRAWDRGRLLEDETADGMTPYLITSVLSLSDELDASLMLLDAAFEDARRRGSVMGFATASYARFMPFYFQGRVLDAIADLQAALDARRYGWESYAPAACWGLAMSQLARGDISAADAAVTVANTDERRWRETLSYPLLLAGRAEVASARHQHREALDLLLEAGQRLRDDYRVTSPAVLPWRSQAALAAAKVGDTDRAMALAADEVRLARRTAIPRVIGVALRAEGLVTGGRAGLDLLEQAAVVLAGSPARLEHARALVELGAAIRREGSQVAAREPLRQALDVADRSGALPLAQRAREELVMAGARPRRAVLSGLDSLTAAERRVATLAGDRLTNREIAEALFVTPKTVEYHLRNVFTKLHVSSRAELAGLTAQSSAG